MPTNNARVSTGLIALSTLGTGFLIVLVFGLRPSLLNTRAQRSAVSEIDQKREARINAEWKRLNIKGAVALQIPQDMAAAELFGDSFAYREAYRNRDIYLTIVYGEISPRHHDQGLSYDACDRPAWIRNQHSYQESVIEVAGTKAKLAIDRHLEPKQVIADLCFPPDSERNQLILVAYCTDERAVATARQIFSSVSFIDVHEPPTR
jgi:hypothetical protein